MAFGQLGLGEYFWEMETREFLNAWIGHIEQKRKDYAADFETAKFGAFYNVFSEGQAKALSKARNPYTDQKPNKGRPVMMGEVTGMLSALAKATNKKN